MNKPKLTAVLALAVAMLFVACDRKTVFDSYDHTPINGWEKNDTLTFAIDSVRQSGEYVEEIGVRINGLYPFTSLSLFVQQTVLPSGKTYDMTLNCRFTDRKGKNKGNGISYYQYSFPMKAIQLETGDSLRVAIRHNMKREILPGVSDIGLKLTKR